LVRPRQGLCGAQRIRFTHAAGTGKQTRRIHLNLSAQKGHKDEVRMVGVLPQMPQPSFGRTTSNAKSRDSEDQYPMYNLIRNYALTGCISALFLMPGFASGQSMDSAPKHVPLQKTIGESGSGQLVPSLIVFNSQGATLQDNKLVLSGIAANSIIFADRPVRAAGHDLTANVIEEWAEGNNSFAKDPPNATVSGFSVKGDVVRDAVVVLKSPVLDGDTLTFDVDVLEGDLSGADGPAAVFIDIIGRPWTPVSYAGAARRAVRRGAFYAGAAYGAAYGPPIYGPPVYHRPLCGYYPYPPCY
jgi:hypothetical protein